MFCHEDIQNVVIICAKPWWLYFQELLPVLLQSPERGPEQVVSVLRPYIESPSSPASLPSLPESSGVLSSKHGPRAENPQWHAVTQNATENTCVHEINTFETKTSSTSRLSGLTFYCYGFICKLKSKPNPEMGWYKTKLGNGHTRSMYS